jgi:hypothetical protein
MPAFLATVLQFQLHAHLCERSGQPSWSCSLHGSPAAGATLLNVLQGGASRTWLEAVAVLNITAFDAGPMLEYFSPLSAWLATQTANASCGWTIPTTATPAPPPHASVLSTRTEVLMAAGVFAAALVIALALLVNRYRNQGVKEVEAACCDGPLGRRSRQASENRGSHHDEWDEGNAVTGDDEGPLELCGLDEEGVAVRAPSAQRLQKHRRSSGVPWDSDDEDEHDTALLLRRTSR